MWKRKSTKNKINSKSMENRHELYKQFLQEFPIESLKDMPIERYSNLDRSNSFCYWIESRVHDLGSVWGGSSYKFGIYRYAKKPNPEDPRIVSDDTYAWYAKYGKETAEEAYEVVRNTIIDIANASQDGDLEKIDTIDNLGESIKWKIAFLYSNLGFIPFYKKDMLIAVAKGMGMADAQKHSIPEIQHYLMDKKEDGVDLFDYYDSMFVYLDKNNRAVNSETGATKTQYWIFAPGDKACAWEECREQNIMVLGWDELGELTNYPDKESLRQAIQKTYGGTGSHKNDVLAVWQFQHELKAGDIVYAKKGLSTVLGRGVVLDDEYYYDSTRTRYKNVRRIQWTHTGEWEHPGSAVLKTLTNITRYSDYVDKLENMILGNENENGPMKKNHKDYIDLLKAGKNLILTGAPGTGKTYLAKMIADEMEAETEFVQFHPSYDYTDFVEGLRPIENGSFERRDGIFKEFCKKALRNLEDSKKSQKALEEERNIEDSIEAFLSNTVENETELFLKTGNPFVIAEYNEKVIRVESKDNEKTPRIDVKMSEIRELLEKNVSLNNVHDIRDYFGRKFGTQQDSYTFVLATSIRAQKPVSQTSVSKINRKDFVFIIDEINRGELSKILGELFFSIDPGYRGEKGRVKTQYQNLVEEDDVFAKGFFIPENVYIIGTMNDIDRSVESMDFAVRRRFTWKEVFPEDRIEMWDDCTGVWKEEAEKRMLKMNNLIASGNVDLNRAYSIGPAYFRNLDNYEGDFAKLWSLHLEPLIKEYLRGSRNINENLAAIKKAYELVDEAEQDHNDF